MQWRPKCAIISWNSTIELWSDCSKRSKNLTTIWSNKRPSGKRRATNLLKTSNRLDKTRTSWRTNLSRQRHSLIRWNQITTNWKLRIKTSQSNWPRRGRTVLILSIWRTCWCPTLWQMTLQCKLIWLEWSSKLWNLQMKIRIRSLMPTRTIIRVCLAKPWELYSEITHK